jgi:hypothetical protein
VFATQTIKRVYLSAVKSMDSGVGLRIDSVPAGTPADCTVLEVAFPMAAIISFSRAISLISLPNNRFTFCVAAAVECPRISYEELGQISH